MEIYTETLFGSLYDSAKPILQQFGAKQYKIKNNYEWTAVAPGTFGAGSWMMRGAFSITTLNNDPYLLTFTSVENLQADKGVAAGNVV